jgi:hypothetical protein
MPRIRAIPTLAWVVCALTGASAQTSPKPPTTNTTPRPPASTPKAAAAKPQPAKTDAQIEATIKAKLAKSPKLSPEHIQVHVQGGVATLEGKTDVIQHKGTATRMAKTAGAVAVNNHIRVSEAAKEKAAGNLDTGRRRAQVKRGDPRSETSTPKGPNQ